MFTEIDVARVQLIRDLRREVGVEEGGLPVVLSLIDQLYHSRRQLRHMRDALDQSPDATRDTVVSAMRRQQGHDE